MATYVAVGMLIAISLPVRSADPAPSPIRAAPTVTSSPGTGGRPEGDEPAHAVRRSAVPVADWQWASRVNELPSATRLPTRIEIPSLDVDAQIVQSGVDSFSQQMAVPPSVDQVGWYRFGPRPGEAGSAVFAGHVDMAGQGPGAFYHLDRLQPGHEVIIHMSDGSSLGFEVVDTARIPKSELDVDAVFDNSGSPRVTLVTCGGAFNRTERTYLDNVISHLRPVEIDR